MNTQTPPHPVDEPIDFEELAACLCKLDADKCGIAELEEALINQHGIDYEGFCAITKALWPLLHMSVSPLTSQPYIGFANKENDIWLAKRAIPAGLFVAQVLTWLTDGNKPSGTESAQKMITIKGTPAYLITVKVPSPQEIEDFYGQKTQPATDAKP